MSRRGQAIFHSNFNSALIFDILKRSKFNKADEENSVKPPPAFQPINLVRWILLLCNYLMSLTGITGVPLFYVDRVDKTTAEIVLLDESERLIYQATLRGNAFRSDNKQLYGILKQFLANTDGWQWIESYDSQH